MAEAMAPGRRDFLMLATTAVGAAGVALACWPFIDFMEPAADTLAAAGPIDVDLTSLQPGQQIVALWRGKPVFIVRRTPENLQALQAKDLDDRLRDPESKEMQQPGYAQNWHRSEDPEFLVVVGICTHLGCVPDFRPKPDAGGGWPAGYFCPCHGSRYDLAGRVFKGVPAPYNLPVPPNHLVSKQALRLGENPKGASFDFNAIEQM